MRSDTIRFARGTVVRQLWWPCLWGSCWPGSCCADRR